MMRRILTAAVTAALAAGPTFLAQDEAFPFPPTGDNPPAGTVGHWEQNAYNSYIQLVGISVNQLNPDYIAKCGVDSPGQKCTISRTDTLTRQISAEFGASSDSVSAAIGISASQSVAIQTGCQSPEMQPSQEYIAFPTETRYFYRVVTDTAAYTTDYGEMIPSGDPPDVSPVAVTAAYDKGFRCRVQQQP
ncbi:hypothetical protein [Pseudonocardia endophytica]|uniref:Peptidase inhibitor family I36 n=1 Tax=Pseudonocardia endophytica TaxID=401976 RepID=A0A4V2PIT0_PSEEN|nr:hypothetical protein [Pseudonocardia endophytica]TCK25436.1 hypothetical protein EV378_1244 [Pseudonocardia endophytica]